MLSNEGVSANGIRDLLRTVLPERSPEDRLRPALETGDLTRDDWEDLAALGGHRGLDVLRRVFDARFNALLEWLLSVDAETSSSAALAHNVFRLQVLDEERRDLVHYPSAAKSALAVKE